MPTSSRLSVLYPDLAMFAKRCGKGWISDDENCYTSKSGKANYTYKINPKTGRRNKVKVKQSSKRTTLRSEIKKAFKDPGSFINRLKDNISNVWEDLGDFIYDDGERYKLRKPNRPSTSKPFRKPSITTAREKLLKKAITKNPPEKIPQYLAQNLTKEQKLAVGMAVTSIKKDGGFLISDGTGLGKTREQLATAKMFADDGKKVLIVSKAEVLKPTWKGKNKGVTGSFKDDAQAMSIKTKLTKTGKDLKKGDIGLSTYSNLRNLKGSIDQDTVLVFDEAHAFKNADSARSKHGMEMMQKASGVLYATATPADKPGHLDYLFRANVFNGSSKQQIYNWMGLESYSVKKGDQYIQRYRAKKGVKPEQISNKLNGLFDQMTENGNTIKREISLKGVDVGFADIRVSRDTRKKMRDIARAYKDNPSPLAKAQMLMQQRRQLEADKVPAAVELVNDAIARGRKPIVFVSRVNESTVKGGSNGEIEIKSEGTAKLLKKELEKAGINKISEIHGGTKKKPGDEMDKFQSGKNDVVIATIESGGTGINLDDRDGDKPRSLIVLTPPFSAVENVQAAGRVWRLKTKSYPEIDYVFSNTKVDKWNKSIIANKMQSLGAIVSGEVGKLNVQDQKFVSQFSEDSRSQRPPKRKRKKTDFSNWNIASASFFNLYPYLAQFSKEKGWRCGKSFVSYRAKCYRNPKTGKIAYKYITNPKTGRRNKVKVGLNYKEYQKARTAAIKKKGKGKRVTKLEKKYIADAERLATSTRKKKQRSLDAKNKRKADKNKTVGVMPDKGYGIGLDKGMMLWKDGKPFKYGKTRANSASILKTASPDSIDASYKIVDSVDNERQHKAYKRQLDAIAKQAGYEVIGEKQNTYRKGYKQNEFFYNLKKKQKDTIVSPAERAKELANIPMSGMNQKLADEIKNLDPENKKLFLGEVRRKREAKNKEFFSNRSKKAAATRKKKAEAKISREKELEATPEGKKLLEAERDFKASTRGKTGINNIKDFDKSSLAKQRASDNLLIANAVKNPSKNQLKYNLEQPRLNLNEGQGKTEAWRIPGMNTRVGKNHYNSFGEVKGVPWQVKDYTGREVTIAGARTEDYSKSQRSLRLYATTGNEYLIRYPKGDRDTSRRARRLVQEIGEGKGTRNLSLDELEGLIKDPNFIQKNRKSIAQRNKETKLKIDAFKKYDQELKSKGIDFASLGSNAQWGFYKKFQADYDKGKYSNKASQSKSQVVDKRDRLADTPSEKRKSLQQLQNEADAARQKNIDLIRKTRNKQKRLADTPSAEQEAIAIEADKQNKTLVGDFQGFKNIYKRLQDGDITAAEVNQAQLDLRNNESSIKADLRKLKKGDLLRTSGWGVRMTDKKETLVDRTFEGMEERLLPPGYNALAYSYDFGADGKEQTKKNRQAAIDKQMEGWTDDLIKDTAKERQKAIAQRDKALEEPKTIDDFRTVIRYKGKEGLTVAQRAKYEDMISVERRAERKKKAPKIQAVELPSNKSFKLSQTTHTKKGHDVFVASLTERVDRDKYNELNKRAKSMGGYYSRYARDGAVPGFQFRDEETARKFMGLEEVQGRDRSGDKKAKANKSLRAVAERTLEAGEAKLNQDRVVNTARRARMAAGVESDARGEIATAKTMLAIAEAQEKGNTIFLDKVSTKIDTLTLDQGLYESQRKAADKIAAKKYPKHEYNDPDRDKYWKLKKEIREKDIDDEIIEYASYPIPRVHKSHIKSLALEGRTQPGLKLVGDRIFKKWNKIKDKDGTWQVEFKTEKEINDLKTLLKRGKFKDSYAVSYAKEAVKDFDRVYDKLDLKSPSEYRAALREYNRLEIGKETEDPIKTKERALIGRKIDGYFPTPKPVIDKMLEYADLKSGQRILEPSAGKGNIADRLREEVGNATVSTIEIDRDLSEILDAKGFNNRRDNFLNISDESYDRIVMNPPFEKLQDVTHVKQAYDLLEPGGRVVSVMSESPFFQQQKKAKDFRKWLADKDGWSEKLPENSFKNSERSTGVNTRLVVIEKPEEAIAKRKVNYSLAPNGKIVFFVKPDKRVVKFSRLDRSVKSGNKILPIIAIKKTS